MFTSRTYPQNHIHRLYDMNTRELVEKTRTVRKFQQHRTIPQGLLHELIHCATMSGSARNAQVLKYMVITDPRQCELLFPMLGWAGYLSEWKGPKPSEKPPAYIICLLDRSLLKGSETEAHFDLGIATQSMLLWAAEQGIFGCRIANYSKNIDQKLHIKQPLEVMLVIALGYPAEKVVLEAVGENGDIKYWRDDEMIHHVPKRAVAEILLEPSF